MGGDSWDIVPFVLAAAHRLASGLALLHNCRCGDCPPFAAGFQELEVIHDDFQFRDRFCPSWAVHWSSFM